MSYLWAATWLLQHNLTLDTRDKHFKLVPKLKLIKQGLSARPPGVRNACDFQM